MQVTVDRLAAEGLPVPPLSSATLLDGYDALEAWTRLSDDLLRMRLRVDRDVTPGMLFIPFCFGEAPANVLTNPQLDPVGKIPEFKFCAARVSPAG